MYSQTCTYAATCMRALQHAQVQSNSNVCRRHAKLCLPSHGEYICSLLDKLHGLSCRVHAVRYARSACRPCRVHAASYARSACRPCRLHAAWNAKCLPCPAEFMQPTMHKVHAGSCRLHAAWNEKCLPCLAEFMQPAMQKCKRCRKGTRRLLCKMHAVSYRVHAACHAMRATTRRGKTH